MRRTVPSRPHQRRTPRTASAMLSMPKTAARSAKATPALVDVHCELADARAYIPGIRADARQLMRLLKLGGCELSVALVSDQAIRELNAKFRGTNRPTDVLSFSPTDDRRPIPRRTSAGKACNGALPICASDFLTLTTQPSLPILQLGDIVISVETALHQASSLRIAPQSRMRTLLTHGLLHLLGYDHERSSAAARQMFAREHELVRLLTISSNRVAGKGAHLRASSKDPRPSAVSEVRRSSGVRV